MYIGHAGLALLAKSRSQRLSLALLVAVAFAPDWIEWALGAKRGYTTRATLLSHSIPAVAVGATVVAVGALLARRTRGESLTLFLLYVSHWLVDFVTGRKPTWVHGPAVGLTLYDHPALDFVLESAIAVACAIAYIRTLPPGRRRIPAWTVVAVLVLLQAAFNLGMGEMT